MKLTKFLMMGCVVATLASCSNEQDAPMSEGDELSFSLAAPESGRSIAVPFYSNSNLPASLQVSALRRDGSSISQYFLNDEFAKNSANRFKGAVNPRYWPETGQLSIYAANEKMRFEGTSVKIDYSNGGVDDATGLIYGVVTSDEATSTNNGLNMDMRQGLVYIVPRAVCPNPNISVEVGSISIHNVKTAGTMTFPVMGTDAATTDHECHWALSGGWGSVEPDDNDALAFIGKISDTAADVFIPGKSTGRTNINGFAVIPHDSNDGNATTAWNPKKDKPVTSQTGSYFKIHCKIANVNGDGTTTNIFKEADGWSDIYVPCSFDWKAGRKYVYTFTFGKGSNPDDPDNPDNPGNGGGYDPNGDEKEAEIYFDVDVFDFENGDDKTLEVY